MSQTFDAYHVWLGIPPAEQPPNHYRLLGLRLFEPNPTVIDNAFQRATAHLRTLQGGPHGPLAQQLLAEVSAAAECLLNPADKSQYDQALGQRLIERQTRVAPAGPPPIPVAAAPPVMAPPAIPAAPIPTPAVVPLANSTAASLPVRSANMPQRAARPRSEAKPLVPQAVKLVGGGVLGLLLGYLLVYLLTGRDLLGFLPPRPPILAGSTTQHSARLTIGGRR